MTRLTGCRAIGRHPGAYLTARLGRMLRAEVRRLAEVVIQGLGQRWKAIALGADLDAAIFKGSLLGIESLRRLLLAHGHDACAGKLLC